MDDHQDGTRKNVRGLSSVRGGVIVLLPKDDYKLSMVSSKQSGVEWVPLGLAGKGSYDPL